MRVKLDKGAFMPTRAHKTDAGLDLYSPGNCYVYPEDSVVIDTGVHVEIPEGYAGFVKSRSGLMVHQGIVTDGIIDCGYTGSIRVKLFNHGFSEFRIDKGAKIAQLVLVKIDTPELELVDELEATEQSLKLWSCCWKLKSFIRMYGNVRVVKGICQKY